MEKTMKKNIYTYVCVYIHIIESLCCSAEIKHNIVNQLYFNNFF